MDIYIKIENAIYTKEKQMESIGEEKTKIEDEIKKSGQAYAVIKGHLFEGVTVEIDGVRWLSGNVKGITIEKVEKRLAMDYMKRALRANGIPAGISYQKLTRADEDDREGYINHPDLDKRLCMILEESNNILQIHTDFEM